MANIDINEVIATSMQDIKDFFPGEWNNVSGSVSKIMEDSKIRLENIAELRLSGVIVDNDQLTTVLNVEKLFLESQLHAIAIVTKAQAQQAANKLINNVESGIINVIAQNIQ